MNGTKTKRKLIDHVSPPREIRENTKERRAWLAAKVDEINAQPNREAKTTGTGSYQKVSVYEVTEVEGRLRYRGVCQFCGNEQVVNDTLVLHGYERPGDGYIFGRCPGVGLRPLNLECSHTQHWYAEAIERMAQTSKALTEKELEQKQANRALFALDEDVSTAGYRTKPHNPDRFRNVSQEQKDEYKRKYAEWAAQFPTHAASHKADKAYELARTAHWQAEQNVRHFQYLLDSKVFGTPLTEEVVA